MDGPFLGRCPASEVNDRSCPEKPDHLSIQESDGDAAFIAKALGDIARAKGMTQVARESGLSRESLYKALSGDRSPSFDTILKVISALGLQLSASVKEGASVEDVAEVA